MIFGASLATFLLIVGGVIVVRARRSCLREQAREAARREAGRELPWADLQTFAPIAGDSPALLRNLLTDNCPIAMDRNGLWCAVRTPGVVHFMIYDQVVRMPRVDGAQIRHPLRQDQSFNVRTDMYKLDTVAIAAIEAHLAVPRPATILAEAARDVSVIILTDTIGESAV